MTDYLTALRTYLLAQATVTNLFVDSNGVVTVPRIYVLGIPMDEAWVKLMPVKVVVLVPTGGSNNKGLGFTTRANVEVTCFGETDYEAFVLERAVSEAIKTLSRETIGSVLLHNATLAGGPTQARDPETLWPAMRRQFTIRADEREIGIV
jgi:hypothetical protein